MPFSREYLPREARRMPARCSNMITLVRDSAAVMPVNMLLRSGK